MSSAEVAVDLTAEPGSYLARQATNVGGNIYESIVTIDLGNRRAPLTGSLDAGQSTPDFAGHQRSFIMFGHFSPLA